MVEQRAKGARADVLTADEPQPVEPLLIPSGANALTNKINGLLPTAIRFYVAACCSLFSFISGHYRAFPEIGGIYTRHARNMRTANEIDSVGNPYAALKAARRYG
jgi:hypothetical protein